MALLVKNLPANAGDIRGTGLIPGSGRSAEGGSGLLTPVFLPGESHGQRSLVGYSPRGCKESDMTEQLLFTFLSLKVTDGRPGDFLVFITS